MRFPLVLMVVAVAVTAACGKHDKPAPAAGSAAPSAKPSTPHGEAALAKMTELRDRACKCTDKPCVDAVSEDVKTWSATDAKTNGALALSEEQAQRMATIAQAMGACIQRSLTPDVHQGEK